MARYLRNNLTGEIVVVASDADDRLIALLALREDGEPNRPVYQELSLFDDRVTSAIGAGLLAPLVSGDGGTVNAAAGTWLVDISGATIQLPVPLEGDLVGVSSLDSTITVLKDAVTNQIFGPGAPSGSSSYQIVQASTVIFKAVDIEGDLYWVAITDSQATGGGGGGTVSGSTGVVCVQGYDGAAPAAITPRVCVMPDFLSAQLPLLAPAPPTGEVFAALQQIGMSALIQAFVSQSLNGAIFDGVDVDGEILVWDLAGENLLSASFAVFVDSATSPFAAPLNQEQLIGSDLSIADGVSIVSAAGGVYNVKVNVSNTFWD